MVPRFQFSLCAHDAADRKGHSYARQSLAEPHRANPSAVPAEEGVVGKAAQTKAGEKGSQRQPEHSVLWGWSIKITNFARCCAVGCSIYVKWKGSSVWITTGAPCAKGLGLLVASVCAS